MTVALYAIAKLTGPLHRLTGWLTSSHAQRHAPAISQAAACRSKTHFLTAQQPIRARLSAINTPSNSKPQTLRIERIVESGQRANQAGRMVISGRMADVCAELDRLVAREAALH